jgi:8-oxo-dGTP pyrophosphatase MutT (NUDIX family)
MHRKHLLEILGRYAVAHPEEMVTVDRMRHFVEAHEDCFLRTCVPGHVTASCWILSADRANALLTHHAKLGRWLQLGGHADGDSDPFSVALREAREESGMAKFLEPSGEATPLPLDMDIHEIPARGAEPAHLHYDLRYLLLAGANQPLQISEESKDLRWVERGRLSGLTDEESVLRLERKATAWLESGKKVAGLADDAAPRKRG